MGHYLLAIYEYLTEQGYDVRVINPIQSEAFQKMYIRQTKNDSKDSRLALVDNCGDCKCGIIALLDQVFPEYANLFSDAFGVTSKELLLKYPTPDDMLNVSIRKLY